MESLYMTLADKTRLRLLNLMRNSEVCVEAFTDALDESQPKISRHLAYLRKAGLAHARRDGKRMLYRIVEPTDAGAGRILNEALDWLEAQPELQKDLEKIGREMAKVSNLRPKIEMHTQRKPIELYEPDIASPEDPVEEEVYEYVGHNDIEDFLL